MCRNIKILFNFDPPVTEEEVRSASLQFVRKITGFNKPSKANEAAFAGAIDEGAHHGAELGGEDAAFDLALGYIEAVHVFGGDVAAEDL